MKTFEEMTKEERLVVYSKTTNDIEHCCDYYWIDFNDMDGICPDCGRATCGGKCVCGCRYSPVECNTCGATPCDDSCYWS